MHLILWPVLLGLCCFYCIIIAVLAVLFFVGGCFDSAQPTDTHSKRYGYRSEKPRGHNTSQYTDNPMHQETTGYGGRNVYEDQVAQPYKQGHHRVHSKTKMVTPGTRSVRRSNEFDNAFRR